MAGLKHDEGKTDWHALPLELVELLVPVAVNGANKYGRHSILQTIEDAGPRHYSATMRHLSACQLDPLAVDPESGCYHAVHAAYDLLARVYQCEGRQEREEVPEMNAAFKTPKPEVYGGYVVCPGCGLKCSIGSEQEQSVNLTGSCTLCLAEKERETYPVPPLQGAKRRAQAATSAQRRGAMDALTSACGYTIPPLQDGDDDPAVHVVPDKTSRSTLPSGCLGRLCGRGDDDEWRPCPEDAL